MRTVIIVPDEALNQNLTSALHEFPQIEIVRQVPSYPEPNDLLRIVRALKPDFVMISAEDFAQFRELAAAMDERMPGLPVISLVGREDPAKLIPQLMHLGVRQLLTSPVEHEQLAETIASIEARLALNPPSVGRLGELYAFFPAKPGLGASTLAVSTSCALANELHVGTLLLDCDLMAGVTKFLLKLGNSSSIVNAMEHAETLDEDLWSQMVGHWDELDVLHTGELDAPTNLTSAALDVVLGFARSQYDAICADLASSLDPFTIRILHEARRIFMVTTPELVPLHMTEHRMRHLSELGLADKVSLLLNRTNRGRRGLSNTEASELAGHPFAYEFSNDYASVQGAMLDGVPVPLESTLGKSIMALAQALAPAPARHLDTETHKRKFLEFFQVPRPRDHDTVWRD